MMLNCLIVDDEPLSLDVLERYISDIPDLHLAGRCPDAFEAMKMLEEKDVDILFLDINMPRLSGINMLKSMRVTPEVVFTTAYPEFAIEGFELEVLDYLLKPISFERFVKAVQKARVKISGHSLGKAPQGDFVIIKTGKKIHKISYDEILYVSGMGDFLKVHTNSKTHISSTTLKHFLSLLPPDRFVRIHKSYVISLRAFKYLEGNRVFLEDAELPMGSTYRDSLLKLLGSHN